MNAKEFARLNRKLQTPAEQIFWSKVRNRKFHRLKFQRQYKINHANILGKKSYFFADFYCHQFKTIVEIDGKIHRDQIEYDEERTIILNSMGYQVIRFKNEDVIKNWWKVELDLEQLFFKV